MRSIQADTALLRKVKGKDKIGLKLLREYLSCSIFLFFGLKDPGLGISRITLGTFLANAEYQGRLGACGDTGHCMWDPASWL